MYVASWKEEGVEGEGRDDKLSVGVIAEGMFIQSSDPIFHDPKNKRPAQALYGQTESFELSSQSIPGKQLASLCLYTVCLLSPQCIRNPVKSGKCLSDSAVA
ncbi:hypothetical protein PAMP_022860 [Pampus punctatissimus]